MAKNSFKIYLKHCMIDLETLGTGQNAVVASVGAVKFSADSIDEQNGFYATLNWQEQLDRGGSVTEDTIRFWLRQPDAAREPLLRGARTSIAQVCKDLKKWFVDSGLSGKDSLVWAKGPQFDLSLLRSLFNRFGFELPWDFWRERDVRTALMLSCAYEIGRPQGSDAHHAFDDAVFQAKQVQRILFATGAAPTAKRHPEAVAKGGKADANAQDEDIFS